MSSMVKSAMTIRVSREKSVGSNNVWVLKTLASYDGSRSGRDVIVYQCLLRIVAGVENGRSAKV